MEIVLEMNRVLNRHENDTFLKERILQKKEAIIRAYFDPNTGDFAGNEQGSNAFAIDLGLGDERTFQNMATHFEKINKYDTGIFATDIVTRLFFEKGREDLAIGLLTSEEDDTFYHHMIQGATTIQEYWTGHRSRCHPMFGAVSRYLYEYVLGIRQVEDSVCYKNVVIKPLVMKQIPWAKGHITTESGILAVSYDEKCICVTVPKGVKATLILGDEQTELIDGIENIIKF